MIGSYGPVFGELMHPHRREYPDDFVKYWERKIWNHWFDYQRTILVSIDEPSCKVVGMADWQRQGNGVEKRELARLDPRLFHPNSLIELCITDQE